MKKVLALFALILTMSIVLPSEVKAQVHYFKTTAYAFKKVNSYGNWNSWSDWQKSNMVMTIDYNNDVVKVYSPKTQTYRITKHVGTFTDSSGGQQVEFAFIDQDGDRGHMRLRIEKNGNSQAYFEFSNIMWVYNVVRTH